MRLIDADKLKNHVEYACLQNEDTEPYIKWFNRLIDAEPTIVAVSREAVMRLIENKPYDWSNLTERHNMLMEIRKIK